jgi:hypothetical protein
MKKGATFSPDRMYRYSLWRIWDEHMPLLLVIGLNGSTADENYDDPTIKRVVWRGEHGGFGGVLMGNAHAYCTMDPREIRQAADPVGPDNDLYLREMIAGSSMQVCAWGNLGNFMGRADVVLRMISEPYCLGLTKEGHPRHPLYVPYSQGFQKMCTLQSVGK